MVRGSLAAQYLIKIKLGRPRLGTPSQLTVIGPVSNPKLKPSPPEVWCLKIFCQARKNQIFIILDLVPVKVQRVGGTHRCSLHQVIQYEVASVASQWQLVLI